LLKHWEKATMNVPCRRSSLPLKMPIQMFVAVLPMH
jgi:hypothetical protein